MDRKVTKDRIVELRQLAKLSDQNIFRRVQLAAQVLADTAWIADDHHGDEIEARQYLSDTCFTSLAGYVQLDTLLAILAMYPQEEQWSEHKYDLRAMELIWEKQRKAESQQARTAKPRATHAAIEAAQQEAAVQKAVIAKTVAQVEATEREMEQWKARALAAESLVIALKAQIAELTREPVAA